MPKIFILLFKIGIYEIHFDICVLVSSSYGLFSVILCEVTHFLLVFYHMYFALDESGDYSGDYKRDYSGSGWEKRESTGGTGGTGFYKRKGGNDNIAQFSSKL